MPIFYQFQRNLLLLYCELIDEKPRKFSMRRFSIANIITRKRWRSLSVM